MYLPASNGNLCILFIYVSARVECICQPLMGTCVYCLYMFHESRMWELVYICFSGSRIYLPASNGSLCILFIYVSVRVECICQPLMGACVYCLYMFQWE